MLTVYILLIRQTAGKTMSRLSRRRFLGGSVAAGAALWAPYAQAVGANNDVRVAVVGLHGRGKNLITLFSQVDGVRIGALCDVDSQVLDGQLQRLKGQGQRPTAYTDVRKLLEDNSIDAVVIATPNHWHSLMGIWACQAGKDVYVEKPVSQNLWEGGQLVAAARKYDSIVASGTQNRSEVGLQQVMQYLQAGSIGKIRVARGLCYNRRKSIGKVDGPQPIPAHIDYDLWSGPAPVKPLMRQQVHYYWHWDQTFGNGDLGNQGIHEMDLCRWALGVGHLPPRVLSAGGRFGYVDDGNTANTQVTILDYEPAPIIFELRGLPTRAGADEVDKHHGINVGIVVECEQGYFAGGRGGGTVYDWDGKVIEHFKDPGQSHQANFIDAVRSRDRSQLSAEIEEGHLSSALCHMANTAYRLARPAAPDRIAESLKDRPLAADAISRMVKHLQANKIDLEQSGLAISKSLQWNGQTQQFKNAEEANRLLTRDYRPGFTVPETV
jgi:predicted dehydrogenase